MSGDNLKDKVGMENGNYCKNLADDVMLVKKRLNLHAKRFSLAKPLDVTNPYCGTRTVQAIKDFQEQVVKIKPDGWVGAVKKNSRTLQELLKNPPVKPAKKNKAIPASIAAALSQATTKWPKRKTASDGTIGDAAHQKTKSDHNPAADGQVHAFDLTHDPDNGVDCEKLAAHLVKQKDKRVKYIIWNKQIINSPGWKWGKYDGKNPHTKHMHVSIHDTDAAETDISDWWPAVEKNTSAKAGVTAATKAASVKK